MSADRSARIAVAFAREAAKSPEGRLCAACVDVLGVTSAGISIMSGRHSGPVCVSDQHTSTLEELQFSLGEGPCQDAFHTGAPVLAPRLDGAASARWPVFAGQAREAGVRAVFAYPLAVRRSNVGALTIYQDREGGLSASQGEDTLAVAAVLAETLLAMQADAAPGLLPEAIDDAFAHRAEVHQASGMVAVQLKVPVATALARIRAYAYSQGRPVGAVAADVVARRLRLADDHASDQGD